MKLPKEEFPLVVLYSQKLPLNTKQLLGNGAKIVCSLPSVGDRSNIILGVPRSNHKEQDRFKDNIIKQQFG